MKSARSLFALLLAAPLAFVACGDEEDSDSTPDTGSDTSADAGDSSMDDVAMGDAGMDDVAMEDTSAPVPTLSEVAEQVFTPGCGGARCHLGDNNEGVINLENDEGLMDRLLATSGMVGFPYVTPNDPLGSYLLHKIEGTQTTVGGSGSRMPSVGSLTDDQILLVRTWIETGANP